MHYYPCKGCAVNAASCERRAQIRFAVKGLSVTSIKFKCTERQKLFYRGQRVEVTLPFLDNNGEYSEWHIAHFHGTVICETKTGGSFKVKIDDGEDVDGEYTAPECTKSGTGYVKMRSEYMRLIDEMDLYVCPDCETVSGGHEDWCPTQSTNPLVGWPM